MTGKKEYVRACPKCGSIDVHTDFSNPVVWDNADSLKRYYKLAISPLFRAEFYGSLI